MKSALRLCLCLLCLFCGSPAYRTIAQSIPDPGLPGSYTVTKTEYNLGYMAATLPGGVQTEIQGSVHYPSTLSGGPFPVLLLLHGRHASCYDTSNPYIAGIDWPPPAGFKPIPNFDGYAYFAQLMASHGYIVISISANAVNSEDGMLSDYGMQARAELIQYHLDLWHLYNTTGAAPFGSLFSGKLDLNRIGTMGHSRGGEGVIHHILHNRTLGTPYNIKAVLTLGPVNFLRKKVNGIPLMNIAPYCDGDVADLQGVHYYDDTRYNEPADTSDRYSVTMMGANHNYFNTVWTPGGFVAGTSDDWWLSGDAHCSVTSPGNKRFSATQQKAAFNAYAAAFFRVYLQDETSFLPLLQADELQPPVSTGLDSTNLFISYHPGTSKRKDINRTDTSIRITVNNLGGKVLTSGIAKPELCGYGFTAPDCTPLPSIQQPHAGSFTSAGLGLMNLRWDDNTDYYDNEIPVRHQDVSAYQYLQFRAAVNFSAVPPGTAIPDFKIQLTDEAGHSSSSQATAHTQVLVYPPGGSGSPLDLLPKLLAHTVKVPLDAFTGIDLTRLRNVRILFDAPSAGAVLLSDFCFSSKKSRPCYNFSAGFTHRSISSSQLAFTDQTVTLPGDTITRLWHFDDPASGTADTSSDSDPEHLFSATKVYRVCLSTSVRRAGGIICTDSVCQEINIMGTGLPEHMPEPINITPNPARDQVYISGLTPGSTIRLLNIYGQTILQARGDNLPLSLPQHLAGGIYFMHLRLTDGTTYVHRLVLER